MAAKFTSATFFGLFLVSLAVFRLQIVGRAVRGGFGVSEGRGGGSVAVMREMGLDDGALVLAAE